MTSEAEPRRSWGGLKIVCLVALAGLSAVGWGRLRIDSSLTPLLPEKSDARRTVLFLRDSTFANQAVLWFRLRGPGSVDQLIAAANAAEKQLDPSLVKRVIQPPAESDAMDQVHELLDDAPELLDAGDLANLEKQMTPDALRKRVHDVYLQLVSPQGSFLQQIIRRDPLGISSTLLTRLQALSNGLGYRVQIRGAHFVHEDGKQLIVILETSASSTSLSGSEALVANLQKIAANAPPDIEITPICPQIHTAQNDRLMQRDINRAGFVEAIAFLLLFFLVSRDWRVSIVFLMPLGAIALAIGLFALVHPDLSTIVIGVAVAMAGSAVDYGIFVYTAVRSGRERGADLRRIRRPLLVSHLTTLGVFFAFLFSRIPAYRELGWLTSVSLILSLLAALFLLPNWIPPKGELRILGRGWPLHKWGRFMAVPALCGGVLLIAGAVVAVRTHFEPDIARLDGVSPAVLKEEAEFQRTWSRNQSDLALLVASGNSLDDAEEANDGVYKIMDDSLPDGQFVSLSSFWPSAKTRRANIARWKEFWSPQHIASFEHDLAAAAAPYGFAPDAFQPFIATLSQTPPIDKPPALLATVEERFVSRSAKTWQVLSFFQDTDANLAAARQRLDDQSDALIVSRRALGQAFAGAAGKETRLLVSISFAFIIASLLILTRSVGRSVLIMLPVVAGLVAMLAMLVVTSLSMSVITVIAAILVLALASDYGVFSVFGCDGREPTLGPSMASVHLSALTTLVGTVALLFAGHPALFLVGVSLTSGLLAGYVTAIVGIPAVWFGLGGRRE
jgi:predicted exporter